MIPCEGGIRLSTSRILKLISAILELILAIPVLGGLIVLGFAWTPLFLMLVLHVVTLVFSANERTEKYPSIVGIVTSVLGWIPFLGWLMHVVTTVLLFAAVYRGRNTVVVQGGYINVNVQQNPHQDRHTPHM